MSDQTISVRTALMPLCCRDFHCLMGACRDNCCDDGWGIEFSKKDYLTIKRSIQSEALKKQMAQSLHRLREREHNGLYAELRCNEEGRCAFHTQEGLCQLQTECGPEALPHVCRVYPRHEQYTAAAKELSLSPSCEEVLALLWELPQGIDFFEEPLPKQDWRQVVCQARFADIRSFCIDVLQERSLPLPQRLLLLGMLLQKLRDADLAAEGTVDRWLRQSAEQLHDPAISAAVSRLPRNRGAFLMENFRILMELHQTERGRRDLLPELFAALSGEEDWTGGDLREISMDLLHYQALEERLETLLAHSDSFFENLMVMTAFYMAFPDLSQPDGLWRSYVELCSLYSFYRFAAVLGCGQEVSRERLFHVLVFASRKLLHNKNRCTRLLDAMFRQERATLAHMAILTGG